MKIVFKQESYQLANPSWQDVYGGNLPASLPPAPRVDTPYVPRPSCPEHCSGRHGIDSEIRC